MEVIAKPKKWGNSIGVIIPKDVLEKEKITLKDELILYIEKKKNKEKARLMKEGYIEMYKDTKKINREWESADYEE
ncbi:MAG: AbrB/MazE/SpoVT family DNA-binding domain-containing protein [Candidatus Aenigmarchaeota archaeon]|nr:AbrB/MazE/SpoVT family DNA-binding domain-containing protein [Candidatus Aenigmarchaeota archaeon]